MSKFSTVIWKYLEFYLPYLIRGLVVLNESDQKNLKTIKEITIVNGFDTKYIDEIVNKL